MYSMVVKSSGSANTYLLCWRKEEVDAKKEIIQENSDNLEGKGGVVDK